MAGRDVHVLAQLAQVADRAVGLAAVQREGIEAVFAHDVEVGDLVDHLPVEAIDRGPEVFRHIGPDGVAVRIIAFVGDHVGVHVIEVLHPELVVDEAADDVPLEHVGRTLAAKVGEGPFVVVCIGEVGALEEIGHPADPPFGQGHAQVRIALPEAGEGPVRRRIGDADRHGGDPRVDRAFVGGMQRPRAGADVTVDHDLQLAARLPERFPVFIVDAGQADVGRVVAERDGVDAQRAHPAQLLQRFGHVPGGDQAHRDEPAGGGGGPGAPWRSTA